MNKALLKAFVREEENERNIESALKLKELVKESIEKRPSKSTKEENISKSTLQSLWDKSEKWN